MGLEKIPIINHLMNRKHIIVTVCLCDMKNAHLLAYLKNEIFFPWNMQKWLLVKNWRFYCYHSTVLLFSLIDGLWQRLLHGLFLEMGFQKFQLLIYGGAGQNCVVSVQPFCEPSLIRFLIASVLLNAGQ